jgi:hypothetical protein
MELKSMVLNIVTLNRAASQLNLNGNFYKDRPPIAGLLNQIPKYFSFSVSNFVKLNPILDFNLKLFALLAKISTKLNFG